MLVSVAFAINATAQVVVVEKPLPGSAFSGLTPGPDGRLYGVTYDDEKMFPLDNGTLYSVDADLSGVIIHYQFPGGAGGGVPFDELTFDPLSGKFYGTTGAGGTNDKGLVFSYTPGANSIVIIRSDWGSLYQPQGPLVISAGFIFGSLGRGGAGSGGGIYRMAIDGNGFTVLHEFEDFSALPQAVTLGADGWLYGATLFGGVPCPSQPSLGCGTLFRLKRVLPGDTAIQFQSIFQFHYYNTEPCPPGDPFCVLAPHRNNSPQRALTYGSDGYVYGQTHYSIFKFDPNDPTGTLQFIWTSGGGISLSVIEGGDNRLYAADYGGGAEGAGRIISMNRDGSGFVTLRTFSYSTGLTAYGPYGRLFRNASGVVYGTTEYTDTGTFKGTVFSISPVPAPKLKVAGGNILIGSPGEGIILKSPGGTTCVKLAIDNAGLMTNVIVPCP